MLKYGSGAINIDMNRVKDLWCSSTIRLLSTQIWMEGSVVFLGCYQHRHEWMLKPHIRQAKPELSCTCTCTVYVSIPSKEYSSYIHTRECVVKVTQYVIRYTIKFVFEHMYMYKVETQWIRWLYMYNACYMYMYMYCILWWHTCTCKHYFTKWTLLLCVYMTVNMWAG